jgi:hypothetical protein
MAILPEPTWDQPTKSYDEQSALCIIRPTPTVVTGLLLQLVRAHFGSVDNIVEPKLKGYLWQDTDTQGHTVESHIQIEPAYKFNPTTVQQRPSILVERGPFGSSEFLLNNSPGGGVINNGNYQEPVNYVILEGSHQLDCIGKTAREAELLGEEVFFRMLEYTPVISSDLNFSYFDVTLLDKLVKVDENHIHFKAAITIKWKFVYNWRLASVSPVLKQIGQSFNID